MRGAVWMAGLALSACGWLGGGTPTAERSTASSDEGPVVGPDGIEHPPGTDAPVPTERWRCGEVTGHDECFVEVPTTTVTLGAQATDPDAPHHDPDARPEEGPVRTETVEGFWIMRHEAPTSLVGRCIDAGGCTEDAFALQGHLSNHAHPSRRGHPANGVSWHGAVQACAWMGGRLPTEAEWELAVRGTDGRRWPWGDDPGCGTRDPDVPPPDVSRRGEVQQHDPMMRPPCRHRGTVPLNTTLGESPFRLLGAAGNVYEWTADPFDRDADPSDPSVDRTLRGGSWLAEDATDLRTTVRTALPPEQTLPDVGFRCVWGEAR